jgi:sensor domain CHASE-containing protein
LRLTQKTLIAVAGTVALLFSVFYLVAQSYVLGVFAELERQQALRTVAQVQGAFQSRIDEIGLLAGDWAAWDDTYAFVADGNQTFIDSNITEVTFANGPLDLIAVYDLNGMPVVERRYDRAREQYLPPWSDYLAQRQPGSTLLTHDSVESVHSGLLMVEGKPLMIAALPVINSRGEGPIRGTLVMAHMFDDEALAKLNSRVHLDVTWSQVRAGDAADLEASIEVIDDTHLLGQQTLLDLFGQPAIALQVKLERPVFRRALAVRDALLVAVVLAALIMALIMRVMLHNLINNAIKFTEAGEIRISVRLAASDEGERLHFAVRDTGIGIAPEAQDDIFRRFVQADNTTTRKFGGTGLGLAISKRLVELMGGTIGLQSQLAEGSTFWFEVPARRA